MNRSDQNTMSLSEYLKARNIDEIPDDEEWYKAEYDAVCQYCEDHAYHLSQEDMETIRARGYEESFLCWAEQHEW